MNAATHRPARSPLTLINWEKLFKQPEPLLTARQKSNVLQSLTVLLRNGTAAQMQVAVRRWNDYEAAIVQAMTAQAPSGQPQELGKLRVKYRLQKSSYLGAEILR